MCVTEEPETRALSKFARCSSTRGTSCTSS